MAVERAGPMSREKCWNKRRTEKGRKGQTGRDRGKGCNIRDTRGRTGRGVGGGTETVELVETPWIIRSQKQVPHLLFNHVTLHVVDAEPELRPGRFYVGKDTKPPICSFERHQVSHYGTLS